MSSLGVAPESAVAAADAGAAPGAPRPASRQVEPAATSGAPGLLARLAGLYAMTRPGVVALVFFTGVPMLGMVPGGWPPLARAATLLAGVAAIAAASSVFNAWLERDRDAQMARTRARPLPTGLIAPPWAMAWGLALLAIGLGLIAAAGTPLAVAIGAATVMWYVVLYTIWLKPRTPLNIVIGGAAGAAPPLIIDAGLTGGVGVASLALFAWVFLWTPPHFWAIALYRKRDYEAAGLPMLPLTHGDAFTRRRIVHYALALVPTSLMPVATGHLSYGFALVGVAVNAWFVAECLRLRREADVRTARRVMFASLAYLHLLCAAMVVDLLL